MPSRLFGAFSALGCGRRASVFVGLGLVVLAGVSPLGAAEPSWVCSATGTYEPCSGTADAPDCSDPGEVRRVALGASAETAGPLAVALCQEQLSNMISLLQLGWDNVTTARLTQECAVHDCRQATSEEVRALTGPPAETSRAAADVRDGVNAIQRMADGDLKLLMGHAAESISMFAQASNLDPRMADPYLRMAYLAEKHGGFTESCRIVSTGAAANADHELLRYQVASCRFYAGDYAGAEQLGHELAAGAKNPDVAIAGRLIAWLGQSMGAQKVEPCRDLVQAVQARQSKPLWDLRPMITFLRAKQEDLPSSLASALDVLRDIPRRAAPRLAAVCGT